MYCQPFLYADLDFHSFDPSFRVMSQKACYAKKFFNTIPNRIARLSFAFSKNLNQGFIVSHFVFYYGS